jgi:hypothetical protein
MPLINGRLVNQETIEQLRAMTDDELVAFRNRYNGLYRGLFDAANAELDRRNIKHG